MVPCPRPTIVLCPQASLGRDAWGHRSRGERVAGYVAAMTDTSPVLAGAEPQSWPGGPHGALVLHGFTGTPQSMRGLAAAFAAAGFATELPLLPGHGTSVDDMVSTTWDDWASAAESAFEDLAARCDRVVVAGAVLCHSVPSFFLSILLILLLSVRWHLLPSGGAGSAVSIIMPAVTIAAGGAGVIARFTRAAMLDALQQPFVRAMLARGLDWPRTVRGHVMPNAAIPTLTMIGFLLGGLVAGAVITETVFAWPGIGRLIITSVARRDLAVVQCIVLLIATTMVLANLTVDLLYVWLDPRMRVAAKEDR